jgi:hypothetical protein
MMKLARLSFLNSIRIYKFMLTFSIDFESKSIKKHFFCRNRGNVDFYWNWLYVTLKSTTIFLEHWIIFSIKISNSCNFSKLKYFRHFTVRHIKYIEDNTYRSQVIFLNLGDSVQKMKFVIIISKLNVTTYTLLMREVNL